MIFKVPRSGGGSYHSVVVSIGTKHRVQHPLERWPSMISMNRPKMESRTYEFLLQRQAEGVGERIRGPCFISCWLFLRNNRHRNISENKVTLLSEIFIFIKEISVCKGIFFSSRWRILNSLESLYQWRRQLSKSAYQFNLLKCFLLIVFLNCPPPSSFFFFLFVCLFLAGDSTYDDLCICVSCSVLSDYLGPHGL